MFGNQSSKRNNGLARRGVVDSLADSKYQYTNIADLKVTSVDPNIYGVIVEYTTPKATSSSDMFSMTISLTDESIVNSPRNSNSVKILLSGKLEKTQ